MKNKDTMTYEEFRKYRESISKSYTSTERELLKREHVSKPKAKKVEYGNRGMAFESIIEATNEYYKDNGLALIRKIPTPVKVLKIGDKGNIEKGFYEKKSALDFNGVLKGGVHIDFDTKETKNKTSFPLGNISEHQMEYMKEVELFGGISFLLVSFRVHEECYILRKKDIEHYLLENVGKKSIEYKYFKTALKDNLVNESVKRGGYICDYLKTVEKLYKDSVLLS